MSPISVLTDTEQEHVNNVHHALESISLEEVNRLLLEFADYLSADYGQIKVSDTAVNNSSRTSIMMSSRYLKHDPEKYLNALKIDYLHAYDDEGASNTRICLRYALRLLPKTYPDVLTLEQDSLLRKELMANIESLETELKSLDTYKQVVLSQSKVASDSSRYMERESTKPVSLLKSFIRYLFS